ncbi:MAG TPA: acyltransferase [Polyangiaceae bacterium]|nr:acyltransferase [Polyangiaceae bacterium]
MATPSLVDALLVNPWLRRAAKRALHRAVRPGGPSRALYGAAFDAHRVGREVSEWFWRAFVATPVFLSKCSEHGEGVAVDRIPYMPVPCRVEVGSGTRFSGLVNITAASKGAPVLRLGRGVFVAHNVSFKLAQRIEVGDYAAIGPGTTILDTEGHDHDHSASVRNRPIWEISVGPGGVEPVVIEDNVQIGRNCMILKGVRIGARSVIGAGSVVRHDVPPDSVFVGNPGRVVRRAFPPVAAHGAANGFAPPRNGANGKGPHSRLPE